MIIPKKSDYPDNFSILNKSSDSNIYFQLVESSASAYFETNWFTRFIFYKRFKIAFDLIPKDRVYNEILDAGCGIGFFLPTLKRISKTIWAIDFAEHSLKYAKHMVSRRKLNSIFFKKVNLEEKIPFQKKFDLIICLSVLEHIRDLDKAIKNLKDRLKQNGILIVGYPNEDNIVFRFFQFIEKRFLRPSVYKTLGGTKLIHFSRAGKIDEVIDKYFYVAKRVNMNLLPFNSFYIIQSCRNS